jgi:hypothetical protein
MRPRDSEGNGAPTGDEAIKLRAGLSGPRSTTLGPDEDGSGQWRFGPPGLGGFST